MMDSHFEVQLTAVLDVLMKSAVTDICALVESWFQSVQTEISESKKENEDLRQKLHIIQQQHEHQQQQAATEADLERKSTKVEEPDCKVRDTDEWNRQLTSDASGAPEMSSPSSSLLNQSASNVNAGLQSWVWMFQVPWDRMPPQISEAISTGQRAQPGARREMVRIVVAAMQECCPNPNRAACAEVARVIVSEYPLTFADMTEEGEQLGSGYHSLLNQLKTRVENVNRSNVSYRIRQPRRPERESDDDSSTPKQIRSKVDSYGCINWQPNNLPEGENPISLESKRKTMTDLFQCAGPKAVDLTEVGDLMSITYVYQRHMINACPPPTISEIQEQWPFLFTKTGLCNHFHILTGIDISSRLSDALISKGRRIIDFFQSQRMKWDRDIQSLLRETEGVSNNMISISAILLVMKYFQEKEDALFISADATATKMLMEEEGTLPVTPRLIMLGDTLLSSTKWMVSIEGKVTHVIDTHLDFAAALAVLFGCFYVFNIEYQESACATLELIQRFFVRINPEGTKCTAKSGVSRRTGSFVKRKPTAFNPRVHAFLQRLTEFEWKTSI